MKNPVKKYRENHPKIPKMTGRAVYYDTGRKGGLRRVGAKRAIYRDTGRQASIDKATFVRGREVVLDPNAGKKQVAKTILLCVCMLAMFAFVLANYIPSVMYSRTIALDMPDMVQKAKTATAGDAETEKWQEGDIIYNGKTYHYNSNLKNILLMGIDTKGPVAKSEDYTSGGQSDAMFLMVVDNDNRKVNIIAINRNTITDVDVYYANGDFFQTLQYQICLQHAYGDGRYLSCDRTMAAVQKLFYNIPISGYLALNMDGITLMNDALGGVEVEVLEDLEGYGYTLKKGETVTLKGDAAELYIRKRDTTEFDSATNRLKRQQQYIINLADKLTTLALSDVEEEQQMALDAYNAVEDYTVSTVDFASLIAQIAGYTFDASDMYTIPGTTTMGLRYEEYNVDEDAFYDMIIDLFYEEVTDDYHSREDWSNDSMDEVSHENWSNDSMDEVSHENWTLSKKYRDATQTDAEEGD